jgi:histidine triad (HIT) family protein
LHENDELIVIRDIMPKAPVHLLVIPKQHIDSVADIETSDNGLIGNLIVAAKQMAEAQDIAKGGYKLVFNVGKDGGQVVPHIHLHLMGGNPMGE